MCGVAGIAMLSGGGPPPDDLLRAMAAALAHRGPDGEGYYRSADVGMVQRRLAIIDLTTGDQPLREPLGAALIANAEIYNYVELRAALPEIAFATNSDCELPLHLYRRYGLDFARHLRGMYALALHDPVEGQLVLARDPFGIKPLYYAETARFLVFASEPQALVAAGIVAPQVNVSARNELLQLQFTTGRETIFSGINRVLPGETIVVRGGRIVERRRIEALPQGPPRAMRETEALEQLDAVLTDSVRVHQRSDVPFGLFLSSGIDSAAVLATMAKLAERRVKTFTAGFASGDVADERPAARAAADAVGAEHVEVIFDENDFWQLLPEIAASVDDPVADYALLPSYKLAGVARQAGIKVILTGEGGDELFGGYGRYRSAMRPWWLGGRSPRSRGILNGLGVLREDFDGWRDGIAEPELRLAGTGRSALQVAQAVDCADWLPNDLLTKLDRCLMAHGSEGRTPFLDPGVAEFAFCLPDALKIRGGLGKWLLRRWLGEQSPVVQPFVRKLGFTVPVARWITRRAGEVGRWVSQTPAIAEICWPAEVERLFAQNDDKRAGHAAWTLLFYALWHRRHIEGLTAPPGALAR
ncbi:MAG: asparagine synthase (glutamine-hydrolyzing) [Alphaproteobacteria bacterium]|nr:asparagine synthase (glutamine-hydrolyzing) [Alphaproteobacteria bacterium]